MKTEEILVRDVVGSGPDGTSVKTTERTNVVIHWLDGYPKNMDHISYSLLGDWRLVRKLRDTV